MASKGIARPARAMGETVGTVRPRSFRLGQRDDLLAAGPVAVGPPVLKCGHVDAQRHPRQATMTLVWTVENQDAAGKWFRVTPKLFENREAHTRGRGLRVGESRRPAYRVGRIRPFGARPGVNRLQPTATNRDPLPPAPQRVRLPHDLRNGHSTIGLGVTENAGVGGSNPPLPTRFKTPCSWRLTYRLG